MNHSIPLIRRCYRNSNLLANFRFFEANDPNHHPQRPSASEHVESTFFWDTDDDDKKTTTSRSERPSCVENFTSTFTRDPIDAGNAAKPVSGVEVVRWRVFSDIGVPTICITLPLTLLALLIAGIVICGRHKINYDGPFRIETSHPMSRLFILVDVSNSWILSLSSVASTVAGYMAPVIMVLQMYLNAQTVEQHSAAKNGDHQWLLTPYQLSLVLGLTSGSLERWWRYERYARATRNRIPHMLRRTVTTLRWSLLLSTCIVIADQVFHYTTTTVQITQATEIFNLSSSGRGLTAECLSLKRENNFWWPCSRDESLVFSNLTEYVAQRNEIFFLHEGISKVSTVELVDPWENGTKLALLTAHDVSAAIDFRASTIGVSSHCRPITTGCSLQPTGPQGSYAKFNCSENFWGILNKTPLSDNNATAVDPDVPPLAFKNSKNLQYGFFADSALKVPYNTLRLNPSTGLGGGSGPPVLDAQLINPIYFAIAGSFSTSSELAGIDLSTDPNFWALHSGPDYLTFVLSCSYQTLNVDYTSFHGKLNDFKINTTSNGSVAELYHGWAQRSSTGVPDIQMQLILAKAALQPSGLALAESWANLFSEHVLGVIGAFTSPRTNLREQSRKKILVTKLSVPALVVLLVLNLAYLPLGLYLCRKAYIQASEVDLHDLFRRFSVPGVVTCRFNDVIFWKGASSMGFDEKNIIEEAVRVQAKQTAQGNFRFMAI